MSIPKIIHFVWVGPNKKTKLALDCIKSWKKYCPDYKIMEWGNEILSEIDNKYVKEALEAKKWAFVSDYIRLYVLKKYGGVYMDADIELTAPIDNFLEENDFFSGFENYQGHINIGTSFIGAVANHKIISDFLDVYNDLTFIKPDGSMDTFPNSERLFKYFTDNYDFEKNQSGMCIKELSQKAKIYPWWYFSAPLGKKENFAIHHFEASWQKKSSILKQFLQGIFSIKNSYNKRHKILTILGLKLKIRRKIKDIQDQVCKKLEENQPKVSVIVPVYNVEDTLRECLDSIINQTLKDIEILCVDDCGKDNSVEIAKEYALKDSRIKILHHEKNKGLGAARNTALKVARGEYIGFVDSDDTIDNDFFEKLYIAAKKYDTDIACGDIYKPNENLYYVKFKKECQYIKTYDKYKITKIPQWCYVWNKIYRAEALKKHKCFFKEGIFYEDIFWTFRTLYFLEKIVTVPNTSYYYNYNPNSIVWQKSQKHQQDYLNALESIQDFVMKYNVKCPVKYFHYNYRHFVYLFGIKILKIDIYKFCTRYYLFDKILLAQVRKTTNKNLKLSVVDYEEM